MLPGRWVPGAGLRALPQDRSAGDLGRVERQQQFLSAVFAETLSPATLLNPFRTWRVVNAGLDASIVDPGFGMWDGLQLVRALRQLSDPDTVKTTVPISDPDFRPGEESDRPCGGTTSKRSSCSARSGPTSPSRLTYCRP